MFEQTFKSLDDIMFQEPGCNSELDYAEQSSWMLFLKYLDDLEEEREAEALMEGTPFNALFEPQYRWAAWAAPKLADGKPDLDKMRIGQDLVDFVNNDLMAYLRGFKQTATDPNSIQAKIGEIFGEVRNKFGNGYMLRDALDKIDQLNFGTQDQKSELSDLYETRIKNMGNAGRNGGVIGGKPYPIISIDTNRDSEQKEIHDLQAVLLQQPPKVEDSEVLKLYLEKYISYHRIEKPSLKLFATSREVEPPQHYKDYLVQWEAEADSVRQALATEEEAAAEKTDNEAAPNGEVNLQKAMQAIEQMVTAFAKVAQPPSENDEDK